MNVRQFLYKVGEALTLEAALADEDLKAAYLEWARGTWPRLAKLEELLGTLAREKFYRQAIAQGVERRIAAALPRDVDLPDLFEQPARLYFEVIKGEPHGLSSSTIGELRTHVVPRLIAQVRLQYSPNGTDPLDALTDCIGQELARVVTSILRFRREVTDRVSIGLFMEHTSEGCQT